MALGFFFLVEGAVDETFIKEVVLPLLPPRPVPAQVQLFAERDSKGNAGVLHTALQQGFDTYILTDLNNSPCITAAKTKCLRNNFRFKGSQISEFMPIVLVACPEIEAWYLAGLPSANPFSVAPPHSTDALTKEQFNALLGDQLPQDGLRLPFLRQLLEYYDWQLARTRNQSLAYFARRLEL